MDLIPNVLIFAAFDPAALLNLNIWACGAALVVALALVIVLSVVRCQIIYVDPDTNYEIAHEKYRWLTKVRLRDAEKEDKNFLGWARDPEGEKLLKRKSILLSRTVELYAIWEKVAEEEPVVEEPVVGIFNVL